MDYPTIMAALSPDERRNLVATYVDSAKVNWAHVCVAQLVHQGYVERVLTTNFDPLIIRASALVGTFTAVYDLAASPGFDAARLQTPALVYLHGQRSGFVMLHTANEVQRHSRNLLPVFEEAGTSRPWLVVGYSGENDPVLDSLAAIGEFESRLYWVVYGDDGPAPHVAEKIIEPNEYAYWVTSSGADAFFVALLRELGCFPPSFAGRPFSYLHGLIDSLAPMPDEGNWPSFVAHTRAVVARAITSYESGDAGDAQDQSDEPDRSGADDAQRNLDAARIVNGGRPDGEAYGYLAAGDAALRNAHSLFPSVILCQIAGEMYEKALAANPNLTEALQGWGNAFAAEAEAAGPPAADKLFRKAYAKFARARETAGLREYRVLNAWALAHADHAKLCNGQQSGRHFRQAYALFEESLACQPDANETYYCWALVLSDHSERAAPKRVEALFESAYSKYSKAHSLRTEDSLILSRWALAIDHHARRQAPSRARELRAEACDKYAQAFALSPATGAILLHWGNSLGQRAHLEEGEVADSLFQDAYSKYNEALSIKPELREAYANWGFALCRQAAGKSGATADALLRQACRILKRGHGLFPRYGAVLRNWGHALAQRAELTRGKTAERLFGESCQMFEESQALEPPDHNLLRIWGIVLMRRAENTSDISARRSLRSLACEKLTEANGLSPGSASYSLFCLSALEGDMPACRRWFEDAQRAGRLPERAKIESDPDLVSLRTEPWFQDALLSL